MKEMQTERPSEITQETQNRITGNSWEQQKIIIRIKTNNDWIKKNSIKLLQNNWRILRFVTSSSFLLLSANIFWKMRSAPHNQGHNSATLGAAALISVACGFIRVGFASPTSSQFFFQIYPSHTVVNTKTTSTSYLTHTCREKCIHTFTKG